MSDKPTRIRKGVEFWPQSEQQTAPWRAISAVFRASQTGLRHEFVTAASGRVFSPAQRDTLATRSSEKKTRQAKLGLLHDEPTRVRKASNSASKWQKPAPLRSISQPSEHRQPVGGMDVSPQTAAASVRRRNANTLATRADGPLGAPRQKDAPGRTRLVAPSDEPTRVRKASNLASKWQKPAPLRSISQPSEHRQPVGGMNSSQQQAAASVRRRNAKRSPHARSSEFHPPKDAPHGTHSIAPCLRDQHVPRASHSPHIVSRLHL